MLIAGWLPFCSHMGQVTADLGLFAGRVFCAELPSIRDVPIWALLCRVPSAAPTSFIFVDVYYATRSLLKNWKYHRDENEFQSKKCVRMCQHFQFPKCLCLITISSVVEDRRTIAEVLFIYLERIHYLQHYLTWKQMYLCHCFDLSNKMKN